MPKRYGWVMVAVTKLLLAVLLLGQTNFVDLAKQAKEASEANRLEEAAQLYQKALALRPEWAEGWFSLGTLAYDQSQYQSAAEAFGRAVKLDAKAGTARVMLGLSEFELGRDEPALRDLQQGIALGFANDEQLRNVALFHEGLLLQRAGQFENALGALAPLCVAGVESGELHMAIGLAVLRLRDKASSLAVVPKAGHAECLGDRKQFDDARAEYGGLVKEWPKQANLHYAYGRFLLMMDHNPDGAVEEFKAEMENQPASALARLQIAAAEYKVDSALGLRYAEEAVKLDPPLPLGHYLLGLLLLDLQEYQRAVPELEIARRLLPKERGVYYALGAAYAHTGREAEAAQARAEFQKLKSEPALIPPEVPR